MPQNGPEKILLELGHLDDEVGPCDAQSNDDSFCQTHPPENIKILVTNSIQYDRPLPQKSSRIFFRAKFIKNKSSRFVFLFTRWLHYDMLLPQGWEEVPVSGEELDPSTAISRSGSLFNERISFSTKLRSSNV